MNDKDRAERHEMEKDSELTYEEAKKPIHGIGEEEAYSRDNNSSSNSNDSVDNTTKTISIKDDNGKEYKYNPNSNRLTSLLEVVEDDDGVQIVGYVIDAGQVQPITWNAESGYAYINFFKVDKYNLTHIKPKWWSDLSNYPAVVISMDDGRIRMVHCPDDWALAENSNYILATKEQMMSLHYQDKE